MYVRGKSTVVVCSSARRELMKNLIAVLACVLATVANCQTDAHYGHHSSHAQSSSLDTEYDGTPGVVTGYVRDIACLLWNPKAAAADPAVPTPTT
jgi:hypothetical protein